MGKRNMMMSPNERKVKEGVNCFLIHISGMRLENVGYKS